MVHLKNKWYLRNKKFYADIWVSEEDARYFVDELPKETKQSEED